MPQTSYSLYIPAVAYPGQLVDVSKFKDFLTGLAYAAAVNYGVYVVTDETNTAGFDQLACRVPAASADVTTVGLGMGISVADQARAQNPAVATAQYPQYAAVSILRSGRIWVNAETAMTDGSLPFIRYAAGAGGTILGNFRNSADTATAVQPAAGFMIVRGTTTAAGYAVIEIDVI
jgi:hypothetical protein